MWKFLLIVVILIMLPRSVMSQRYEQVLDSLKGLKVNEMPIKDKLKTYDLIIAYSLHNEDSTIKYAEILLLESKDRDVDLYAGSLCYLGQAYIAQGDYQTALAYLLQVLEVIDELDNIRKGFVKSTLGKLYARLGELDNMRDYYLQAVGHDSLSSLIKAAASLNNLADGYYQNQVYDSSLHYFAKAKQIYEEEGYIRAVEMIEGSEGLIYAKTGQYDLAEPKLIMAVDAYKNSRNINIYLVFKLELANLYILKGQYALAEEYLLECFELAKKFGLKEYIRDASDLLSILYEHMGNYEKSLGYYRLHQAYKDSIENVETVRTMANMRKEFEVGQKQAEVDLLTAEKRNQRLILIGVSLFALVFVVLAFIIYRFYQSKARINAELERLNQTKDKFFSIISHDLRGPVSSFMGISRMIKFLVKSKETDQLLEVADDIDESVDRLSALLDNLLNWAMQQQGHFPNVPEKVNLEELSEDLVRTLHTMAKGKHIDLEHSVSSEINLWVDRNTTMTILRNLVNNALKFTSEGGRVSIEAHHSDGVAQINVSDTGVGIPKEKLDKLFQLEDKKSTYGTSGEKGLGLGLQLVYEFVEMNQGSLKVESEEGKGTTFTVLLPTYEMEANTIDI